MHANTTTVGKTNLGRASSKLAGETGRSRSRLKSMLSNSGRFLLLLPVLARRAHERSKLPYDDVFRSRKLFSLADDRKKSIKLLSSSSLSTRLRRLLKLPVGVISEFERNKRKFFTQIKKCPLRNEERRKELEKNTR